MPRGQRAPWPRLPWPGGLPGALLLVLLTGAGCAGPPLEELEEPPQDAVVQLADGSELHGEVVSESRGQVMVNTGLNPRVMPQDLLTRSLRTPHQSRGPQASVSELRARAEARPQDPKGWFELGDALERLQRYVEAADAFKRFHEATERLRPDYYTAGHYHLGRIYFRVSQWELAVYHLGEVLELKPDEDTVASLNPHFREAHLLLGVVYYQSDQHDLAREHLLAYEAISGNDLRAEQILAQIEMRREAELSPLDR